MSAVANLEYARINLEDALNEPDSLRKFPDLAGDLINQVQIALFELFKECMEFLYPSAWGNDLSEDDKVLLASITLFEKFLDFLVPD